MLVQKPIQVFEIIALFDIINPEKSRDIIFKIPGSGFDFNPGIPGYPRIPLGPAGDKGHHLPPGGDDIVDKVGDSYGDH